MSSLSILAIIKDLRVSVRTGAISDSVLQIKLVMALSPKYIGIGTAL